MQDATDNRLPPPTSDDQDARIVASIREWWEFHSPAALNDPTLWERGSDDLIDFLIDMRAESGTAETQA
jgi:hypothetical protein